ncbi:AAA family ATPase [Xanthomonas sontii]|uniref:AAA family ATPase n=1 Tax=Xanthomonas sontii TaxID=2650745 RepID=A0A6N7QDH1_9XANT|nr:MULTISPECIES: AAA family ATPase [Xanthomonas]MRH01091.1 AAA family ATPase [Xanthomonas sontii]MRH75584.1 AAA family ATPase [Xanthomonas sontii]UYK76996.1 AAA family ATPase [Xanthomonas sacchari]
MIRTVNIQDFRSFDPASNTVISFDPDKRVAYFYGLNGAGKSAISEVIQRCGTGQNPVPNCTLSVFPQDTKYEYLVYNDHFVETNFRNRSDMPGIFTIGDPESSALEAIEVLEQEIATWRGQHDNLVKQQELRQAEATNAHESAIRGVWKNYTALKDGPFKRWLPYGNSKQRFFDALQAKAKLAYDGEPPDLDKLEQLLIELGDSNSMPKPRVDVDLPNFNRIEQDEIWAEPIIGSSDSALSAMIKDIANFDWVSQGRSYVERSHDLCPFCQQSLPPAFPQELAKLFDESFERRVERARQLASSYASSLAGLEHAIASLLESEAFASETDAIRLAWANASRLLSENAQRMAAKSGSPQSAIELHSTQAPMAMLEDAINEVSKRVDEHNRRLSRRQSELNRIENGFWARLREDNEGILTLYKTTSRSAADALEAIRESRAKLQWQISQAELRLVELRATSGGTEEAVVAINTRLQSLGVDSFKIERREDDLYQLVRPGKGPDTYGSLSEGEKTLITFLYFVELITGSPASSTSSPLERKIVVIDDPISSLSHNFVYDIAATISRDIIGLKNSQEKRVKQVIVLTHSLFFLNELIKVSKKADPAQLQRVIKKRYSAIVPMKIDDLKNDYESWWQVVKDAYQDLVSSATVANAMRCILERFFYFTKRQDSFSTVMDKLAAQDRSFFALSRYLAHHSHGDANTLTDFGEYDVTYCLIKFKAIFDELGFSEHHRVMAGLPDAAAE